MPFFQKQLQHDLESSGIIKLEGVMKARQYTGEQIIAALKEGEAGGKVADLCYKYERAKLPATTGKQGMPGCRLTTRLHSQVLKGSFIPFRRYELSW